MDELTQEQFQREQLALKREINRALKRAEKRHTKEQETLSNCLAWANIHHEALLIQSQLFRLRKGMHEVIVADWENDNRDHLIPLNPLLEPHLEVAKRFKKSRKLRTGIPHHQRILKEIEEEIQRYKSYLEQLETIDSQELLTAFRKQIGFEQTPSSSVKTVSPRLLPFREYLSNTGIAIWVGKSSKGNDAMTFQHAKGSDWWLHVNDFPGSHVVIRVGKNQEPDPESLQDAMQLAIFYSKAKDQGSANVCVTQRKYVSRYGKDRPGTVHISKHRTLFAKLDPVRLKRLQNGPTK